MSEHTTAVEEDRETGVAVTSRDTVHGSTVNLMNVHHLKQLEHGDVNTNLLKLYHYQLVQYERQGRCIVNCNMDRSTKWITVPLAYALTPGYVYQWSVLVDQLEEEGTNYWKVIVGVVPHPQQQHHHHQPQQHHRRRHDTTGNDHYCDRAPSSSPSHAPVVDSSSDMSERQRMRRRATGAWIGCEGTEGIGLILASNRLIYRNNDFYKLGHGFAIRNGDVVTVQFNMVNSSDDNDDLLSEHDLSVAATKHYMEERRRLMGGRRNVGASITFFLNGEPIMQEPFDYLSGQHFYPAVSMINRQKVTVLNIARFKVPEAKQAN